MVDAQLKHLITAEKSAVQVYKKILKKVKDYKEVVKLNTILKDHENAVKILQMYNPNSGGGKDDAEMIGPWSNFAHTYNGSAHVFNDRAILKSLRSAEEFEVSEFKQAMNSESVSLDIKKIIQEELLPKQRNHVTVMSANI